MISSGHWREESAKRFADRHDGVTALVHAASKGHRVIVKLLIAGGADVDLCSEGGWTQINDEGSRTRS
jgi:ankyrin repeat protein